MFESLPSWKTYIFPYVVCKALYLCIFPWVVTEMDPSHVNNFPDVQAILGIFVPWFGFWVGSQHLLWGDLPVGCHMSQSYSFKRGALGIWEFFFFLIGESELMLQIYHVQEAVRSLWVFWGATHTQLQSFGSPCRALGPAKAIGAGWGQSPGWTMIMGWFLTSISGFFGIFQEQRHLVVFFPLVLNVSRFRMKIRFTPGGTWFLLSRLPGKNALNRSTDLIPLLFLLFVFWGGQSSQSFPEEIQTAGAITRHDCRIEGFFWSCLLYLAQNFMFLICICFLLIFLPYEGNSEFHKWAAKYEHIYFDNYFSDY